MGALKAGGGHVTHVAHAPPGRSLPVLIVMPLATPLGGAERQFQQLIDWRAEALLAPTIAFLQPGPLVSWCQDLGVPSVPIAAGRMRHLRRAGFTVRALVKAAHQTRAEVVIGWMAKGQLYGGLAAAAAGLPSVWLQPGAPPKHAYLDRVASLLPARVVITVSRTSDRAQRDLFPHRPTSVVWPAVDTARFDHQQLGDHRAVRRRLGLPEDGLIFGSVGRLQRGKGFEFLLEAAREVFAHHPDATLLLVGGAHDLDPTYADQLRQRAAQLEHGRVLMVGQQSNPEEWMQAMDVFAFTSQNEPFGIVVIEAMALGKPVVASAEAGPAEIITSGRDGVLTPYGDVQALATAILSLAGDARRRTEIGKAAMRRARDFTVQRFAQRFGETVARAATDHRCVE